MVSLIVAMDERGGIGLGNRLPWHLSADLKRFKSLTMGHHLLMGRRTYESIGRPLPGRTSILITQNRSYSAPGCLLAHSLEEALDLARSRGENEAFVIGGARIFSQALATAGRIYLTRVHARTAADVFFPEFDPAHWVEQGESQFQPADEKNQYPSTFRMLARRAA